MVIQTTYCKQLADVFCRLALLDISEFARASFVYRIGNERCQITITGTNPEIITARPSREQMKNRDAGGIRAVNKIGRLLNSGWTRSGIGAALNVSAGVVSLWEKGNCPSKLNSKGLRKLKVLEPISAVG